MHKVEYCGVKKYICALICIIRIETKPLLPHGKLPNKS